MKKNLLLLAFILVGWLGCKPDETVLPEDEDINLGGETSVSGAYINIFQQPAANLNAAEADLHRHSDRAFGDIFVTAPSITHSGLGPVFNQNSCESCHIANGKSPFPNNNTELRGLLLRISMPGVGMYGAPNPVPHFGGQLQTKAVFGKPAEATLTWQEVTEIKTYLDGESVALRRLDFGVANAYADFPNDALMSPRIAPAVIGLGLLEAISESDILALADPNDADADGISGKPNWVWDYAKQQTALGRFGWKAGQPTLLQQTAAAYNNDMGITSPYFPQESCYGQTQADPLADDPEIDENTLKMATFYPQSLAVPQRRNWDDAEVINGKALFIALKCASCHNPKFVTGASHEYAFLNNQTIFPYTDLLLHDMGEGLADNRPDFEATGSEWRTPPLWGIGLTQIVGGHSHFLHDGRARSLEEAIMWHGGEAEASREAFGKLSKAERNAVIKFLESL